MEFDNKVILFLDVAEASKFEFKIYMKERGLEFDVINRNENIAQIHLVGKYINIEDILELEDVLDKRLTICSKYIGSAETIRSLGLD